MPNEAIQCPNCGSGDVLNVAADSYICEHCHTSFRWVNPTMSTVAQKPTVCACGTVASAFCVRCHEPLCEGHRKWHRRVEYYMDIRKYVRRAFTLLGECGGRVPQDVIFAFVKGWGQCRFDEASEDHRIYYFKEILKERGVNDYDISFNRNAYEANQKWVNELLKQRGVDVCYKWDAVLCERCVAADWKAWGEVLEDVFASFPQRIAEGRVCATCLSTQVAGQCGTCGRALCPLHCFACTRCHQPSCESHEQVVDRYGGRVILCARCHREADAYASPWLDKLLKKVGLKK
jgi:hypothetical protein